jgi:hypothetical protein
MPFPNETEDADGLEGSIGFSIINTYLRRLSEMKKTALGLALVGLLTLGGQAVAVICTIDAVPAATLLLPYFEVDLSNPNGLTTLFSINNASATAVLTHVVIRTDLSVEVLDFNVYLTGYDVQTINLRDIILSGLLPQTASEGQDESGACPGNPGGDCSPQGKFSQDINFASCNGFLPPQNLDAATIAYLQAALTGKSIPSLFQTCGGPPCCTAQNLGDNIARGYITVDTVSACTILPQSTLGYFQNGGTGIATNQNVLWGDWFIVNATQSFAEGGDLVHIEAAPGPGVYGSTPTTTATTTSGDYTFYGRLDKPTPFNAFDNREPLATNFATRFLNGGTFSAGTSLLCWRDSKTDQQQFNCPVASGNPSWYPLGQEGVIVFDEQEHPIVAQGCSHSPCPTTTNNVCPAETQRVLVGGASLSTGTFNFGWLFMDLNFNVGNGLPPNDPLADQSWVISTLASNGKFAVGLDAIRLDSACAAGTTVSFTNLGAQHPVIPFPTIPTVP